MALPEGDAAASDCLRCHLSGLVFDRGTPAERRVCGRHTSPDDAALLDALDVRGRAIGIKRSRYPYGPNIDVDSRERMLDWAEAEGITAAPLERHVCLSWILERPCRRARCYLTTTARQQFADHLSGWLRDGKPAGLVSHPYALDKAGTDALAAITTHHQLSLEVRGEGWYGSSTYQVAIWRAES